MTKRKSLVLQRGDLIAGLFVLLCAACAQSPARALTDTATTYPTSVPTETPRPSATLTPTETPTLLEPSLADTSLQTQADGTQWFSDRFAGYQIILPPQWIVLDLSGGDFGEIVEDIVEENPQIENSIMDYAHRFKDFRIMVFDEDPEHFHADVVPNLNIVLGPCPEEPLPLVLHEVSSSLQESYPGIEILESQVVSLSGGLSVGQIDTIIPLENAYGVVTQVYTRHAFTFTDAFFVIVTMGCSVEVQDELQPVFDEIVESFSLIVSE